MHLKFIIGFSLAVFLTATEAAAQRADSTWDGVTALKPNTYLLGNAPTGSPEPRVLSAGIDSVRTGKDQSGLGFVVGAAAGALLFAPLVHQWCRNEGRRDCTKRTVIAAGMGAGFGGSIGALIGTRSRRED